MPAPSRWTETDRPARAACAAALGGPGQTRNENEANGWELRSGPGLAPGEAPEALGAGVGPAELAGPAELVGPAAGEDLAGADGGALPAASAPGASPEWRPDQPWKANTRPATAVTASTAAPRGPTGLPLNPIPSHNPRYGMRSVLRPACGQLRGARWLVGRAAVSCRASRRTSRSRYRTKAAIATTTRTAIT